MGRMRRVRAILVLRADHTIDMRFEVDIAGRLIDAIGNPPARAATLTLVNRTAVVLPAVRPATAQTAGAVAVVPAMTDAGGLNWASAAPDFEAFDRSMFGEGTSDKTKQKYLPAQGVHPQGRFPARERRSSGC